jgi:peptide/nickel transport system ATP-binding protein
MKTARSMLPRPNASLGIIDLLFRLQRELGLTYLFISHDLSLARQLADTVSVLQRGRVVEDGPAQEVFSRPKHPYTETLLDAIPALPSVSPMAPSRGRPRPSRPCP